MKHLFSLSLLLLSLLLPTTATAHDFEVDGIYYNIVNGNEATVTYRGSYSSQYCDEYSGSVTIPSSVTYGGTTYSVTAIGNGAFNGCTGLTSITIPNSVTSIGGSAFSQCISLTSVTIPNSVTTIGSYAFEGTAWYNNQPDGVVYAGLVAYKYKGTMPNGTSITLRDGTLGIAGSAFEDCTGLTSITIPNSVTNIGGGAFYDCSSLTSATIPNSVTSIGKTAFYYCSALTSIVVAGGNPNYDSRGNCNAIIETASNTLITGCMNTVIPNSVTSIGDGAFYSCSGLTSIDIPNSVISIGLAAFYCCSGLTSVTIGNSVTSIGDGAFYSCSGLTSINIPNSVTFIDGNAFECCESLSRVDIIDLDAWCNIIFSKAPTSDEICFTYTSNPLFYAGHLFLNGEEINDLFIPNTVTTIRDGAFINCSGLTSIDIPNSVISIGEAAFQNCSGLTSITIGDSVTSIGEAAFQYCSGLGAQIDIPNSVISIGDYAFECCSGLTSVTIGDSVTSIGGYAFSGCSNLASVTIGSSVNSIGEWAFADCINLTEIYCWALIPPTIDYYTFFGCNGLIIYVPKEAIYAYKAAGYWEYFNIIGIGSVFPNSTFVVNGIYYRVTDTDAVSVIANEEDEAYYTGDVAIPESVTYEGYTYEVTGIESNAFEDCYELTSVVIPNSVTDIGEQAFQGCTGLTSVTIGSGVTAIGTKAFNYCNALETIKCIGTVPPVMASADCFSTAAYNRATLLVPRNSEATYAAADYWYKFAHIDGWGSAGRGDVNGDGVMNIADVTFLIDVLLTGDSEGLYFESADLNSNNRLDIGDVTSLIDDLLNGN